MFAMDGSDPVGQEFWNQLTSISSELAPGDMWQQPPTPHSAAVGSMPIPAAGELLTDLRPPSSF